MRQMILSISCSVTTVFMPQEFLSGYSKVVVPVDLMNYVLEAIQAPAIGGWQWNASLIGLWGVIAAPPGSSVAPRYREALH